LRILALSREEMLSNESDKRDSIFDVRLHSSGIIDHSVSDLLGSRLQTSMQLRSDSAALWISLSTAVGGSLLKFRSSLITQGLVPLPWQRRLMPEALVSITPNRNHLGTTWADTPLFLPCPWPIHIAGKLLTCR
jgi:hypothetical protein